MAGIIKKEKSAYGKRRKKNSKTYNAYMAAMAAPAEAAVDDDVPAVVVAAAIVEVPPRSCIYIFTVLPLEDTSRPASWKTARTVHACDRSAAEADVDVDVLADVVAAAVVEVPPRSCVDIFTVLPPDDTSRPASWKTSRMVQARDCQITKEKANRLIFKGKLANSNAATTKANTATKKVKDQLRAVKASLKMAAESSDKGKKKVNNEKTARIAAERRAKLHAERATNANHNTWLEKKVSIDFLELQQQTA